MAAPGSRGSDRPLRADAQKNRKLLLAAAEAVFAERGIEVPIDDVAARAGVGVGTLYRHFATKEALFAEIVQQRYGRLIDEARARAADGDREAAFLDFLRTIVREGKVKHDLVDALTRAGMDVKDSLLDQAREMRAAISVLLVRAQEARAVRSDVGIAEVMALITGTIKAIEAARADDAFADRLIAIMADGLRCRAS